MAGAMTTDPMPSFLLAALLPQVDPLPLPAPVWVFKALHDLTLSLHFCAMFWLIGALVLALAWNGAGRLRGDRVALSASGVVAARLPILTVYVINLGVPPLLFAQVLYGRALYSSSVLIGAWWIAVIPLLILAYALLHTLGGRALAGRPWWGRALASLLALLVISKIYSVNMALMLRPDAWAPLYAHGQSGLALPGGDPTLLPRWTLMLASALAFGAMGASLFSLKTSLDDATRRFLRNRGARLAPPAFALVLAAGFWAFHTQAPEVRGALLGDPFHATVLWLWPASVLLALTVGALGVRAAAGLRWRGAALLFAPHYLWVALTVLARSGVRDVTLRRAGLDVWDRVVTPNWMVTGVFLALFVAGLACAAWLALVARRAHPTEENYA